MSEEVRNAAERLRKLLRAAQYPQLSALQLENGDVADLLRVLHFVLLDSSRDVAQFLVNRGYDLYGKTDARFVESCFRLLRDEFRCFPSLSVSQFLSKHFVARRLAIVADAATAVAQKRQELQRLKRREETVWAQPQGRRETKATVENHVLPTSVTNHAASILQHLKTDGRQVPRASSEPSVQANGTETKPVTATPLTRPLGRYYTVDDGVQTEAISQDVAPKPCSCFHDTDKLATAVADLSRQLGELSSALMSKMSSVESRLGRLEDEIHGIRAAVEDQRDENWRSTTARDRDTGANLSMNKDLAEKRALDVERPCAWPPQPSVFERY
ncbi:Centrosomal protein [Phytophthora citrophthora]|uniref:Centrosomal protein of 44 kDa n=1 Tax=Phytophthora citrophthora TaxID=4793 RepID=A0AAD9FYJ5_9STRA|nr:Centrosomal protein [Phytophthora citrophthora]